MIIEKSWAIKKTKIKSIMKKLLFTLTMTVIGFSQTTFAQDVDFGVKAGLNIANFSGGDGDRNSLLTYHLGGVAEISLSERFSLQPEVLYTRQGSEAQATNEQEAVKVKLDYLAIPLMAKYYIADRFTIEVGPQFAFLLEDKAEFVDADLPDADTDASGFDLLANIGLGYAINNNIFLQTRYSYGITTVVENPDIKNSVFQVSLGYTF